MSDPQLQPPSQLHSATVDSLLASADPAAGDRDILLPYFTKLLAEADEISLAYRLLSSIFNFLKRRVKLSELQNLAITALLNELQKASAQTDATVQDPKKKQPAPDMPAVLNKRQQQTERAVATAPIGTSQKMLSTTTDSAVKRTEEEQKTTTVAEGSSTLSKSIVKQPGLDYANTKNVPAGPTSITNNHRSIDPNLQSMRDVSIEESSPLPGFIKAKDDYEPQMTYFHPKKQHKDDADTHRSQELRQAYPKATKMLKGFDYQKGLGRDNQGIKDPINNNVLKSTWELKSTLDDPEADRKARKAGLGHESRQFRESYNAGDDKEGFPSSTTVQEHHPAHPTRNAWNTYSIDPKIGDIDYKRAHGISEARSPDVHMELVSSHLVNSSKKATMEPRTTPFPPRHGAQQPNNHAQQKKSQLATEPHGFVPPPREPQPSQQPSQRHKRDSSMSSWDRYQEAFYGTSQCYEASGRYLPGWGDDENDKPDPKASTFEQKWWGHANNGF